MHYFSYLLYFFCPSICSSICSFSCGFSFSIFIVLSPLLKSHLLVLSVLLTMITYLCSSFIFHCFLVPPFQFSYSIHAFFSLLLLKYNFLLRFLQMSSLISILSLFRHLLYNFTAWFSTVYFLRFFDFDTKISFFANSILLFLSLKLLIVVFQFFYCFNTCENNFM